ncbi:MAG: glycosyltransferase family 39 protein [Phocaeicola plebeius]|nr:glycosyltransferase family 39 protein [Phocaeicola plebeius]
MSRKDTFIWILAAACLLSLFLFMGETHFNTRGEPREAVVALSMLKDGNWILPVNNGIDLAYKPPLFHWLIAAISTLTGEVTEYTSRMPSALALTFLILAGFSFYARRRDSETAFLMGLLTLTNFEVHRAGVNCRVDMLLAALMVLALYALYRWGERGLKGIPWGAVLCLSGAFLTKGPVGAVLPCIAIAVFLLLRGHRFWPLFFRLFGIGLLSCLLPLAWYVAAWQQGGDRFLQLVLEENVLRFLGKMSYESHINPWHYNVLTLITGFLPYTLLVVLSLSVLPYRRFSVRPRQWWNRLRDHLRQMDDTRLFTWVSLIVIFVFYCIPKSKRSVYLLPVYPFLAYFLAEYILWLVRRHRRTVTLFGDILCGLSVLLFAAFVAVRSGLVPDSLFGSGKSVAQNVAFLHALEEAPTGIVQLAVVVLPFVAIRFYLRYRSQEPARLLPYTLTGMVFALFLALDGFYQPTVLNVKSDYGVARQIARIVPQGRVYSYRTDVYEANRMHPFTVNFYLGDRVVPFDVFLPAAGYLLAGNDDIDTFRQVYPSYRVDEVVDFRHKSGDDHKWLHLYRFHEVKPAEKESRQ